MSTDEKPDEFWMVYVEGGTGCRHQHPTEPEARAEAERLARLPGNANKKVFLLMTTAFCRVGEQPVTWYRPGESGFAERF